MTLKALIISIATCLAAAASPTDHLRKSDAWFSSAEGRKTTGHVLSWQTDHGDWPKNTDTARKEYTGDRARLKGTFDNGATTGELRYLARAFRATGDERCHAAVTRGIDHILKAQYPNGGWPQYFPLSKSYHRHITFNDGSMIRVMEFIRDVSTSDDFRFIGPERRKAAAMAVERGIDCIVKCQVVVNRKPTVWCAQHDEITLAPTKGRAYELASLSGAESAGILRFLMSLEKPSREVIRAVNSGVKWFESAKLEGIRVVKADGDRKVIKDAAAPPLWARFYEIETTRPIFCDRDGVIKYSLAEIGRERRNGYAWYGNWGDSVLKAHVKWRHR
jgi:PelA/Pel-15E family pectate lyase